MLHVAVEKKYGGFAIENMNIRPVLLIEHLRTVGVHIVQDGENKDLKIEQ